MLRITEMQGERGVTLRLEGKLLAAWVGELRTACLTAAPSGVVQLDLRDLTYVDAAGAAALRGLCERGATIVACSNFVSEVLEGLGHA